VPELVEVEIYRQALELVVGRTIESIDTPDLWFVKGGASPADLELSLAGGTISSARRLGKLLSLDVRNGDTESVLGMRFGMTGRIAVDGWQPIAELLYSSNSSDQQFVRFRLELDGGGAIVMIDPRRLGGVELMPDESRLGPDAASIRSAELLQAVRGKRALKTILLDQSKVSGVGNLICDETLWRSGLSPRRLGASLGRDSVGLLARRLRSTIALLQRRGGSHLGDLQPHRQRGSLCPRDGYPLRRDDVGGRTTYWCPDHQL
jgi:formamidopyrimidine-DNA glycosylase